MNKPQIILLDTNVVVDVLLNRENAIYTNRIIELAIDDEAIECVTTTTVTDIHYLYKKYSDPKLTGYEVQDKLRDLLYILDMLPVTAKDVFNALECKWSDLEDALQYCVAVANGCDCIITNNTKDFENPQIEVISPKDFIDRYLGKGNQGGDDGNQDGTESFGHKEEQEENEPHFPEFPGDD